MKKIDNFNNHILVKFNKKEYDIIYNIYNRYYENSELESIFFNIDSNFTYFDFTIPNILGEIYKTTDDYYIFKLVYNNSGEINLYLIDQLSELKLFFNKVLLNKMYESKLENESIEKIKSINFDYNRLTFFNTDDMEMIKNKVNFEDLKLTYIPTSDFNFDNTVNSIKLLKRLKNKDYIIIHLFKMKDDYYLLKCMYYINNCIENNINYIADQLYGLKSFFNKKIYLEVINESINESSIGSENIRNKYYGDFNKREFYSYVNLDPTSIRKKDFSKPGKYTKWIINQVKKYNLFYDIENKIIYYPDNTSSLEDLKLLYDTLYKGENNNKKIDTSDDSYSTIYTTQDNLYSIKVDEFKKYLYIFSSNWFKKKFKNTNYLDIYRYSIRGFILKINSLIEKFELETEKAKYDTIYLNNEYQILVPINFTGSYETAKNTEWCSSNIDGWNMWSQSSILYRVLFKNGDKLKITYREDNRCFFAIEKYPEILIENPFMKVDNKYKFQVVNKDLIGNGYYSEHYQEIYNRMFKLNNESIEEMIKYIKNKGYKIKESVDNNFTQIDREEYRKSHTYKSV